MLRVLRPATLIARWVAVHRARREAAETQAVDEAAAPVPAEEPAEGEGEGEQAGAGEEQEPHAAPPARGGGSRSKRTKGAGRIAAMQ